MFYYLSMYFMILRGTLLFFFFFFQAEDGIRDGTVTWSSDVCSSDLTAVNPAARLTVNPAACGASPAGGAVNPARWTSRHCRCRAASWRRPGWRQPLPRDWAEPGRPGSIRSGEAC